MAEIIEWEEFADAVVQEERVPLSPGLHNLYVRFATFNPDQQLYTLTLTSLDKENEESDMRFYLVNKDGSPNTRAQGTLVTLKRAVTGIAKGILVPSQATKCVVRAEVKMTRPKDYNGDMKSFPIVYEFFPVEPEYLESVKAVGMEISELHNLKGGA